MAATYTTAARVSSLLLYTKNAADGGSQERLVFDATSNPTKTEVEDLIEETEEIIDEHTEQSWKLNTLLRPEYHDFVSRYSRWGSYIDRGGYQIFSIKPKKANMKTFDTEEGDKIEVLQGDTWVDFVADKELGVGMYDGDYWIDYEENWIYLFNDFPSTGQNTIRITYRYGETSVPLGIRRACTLLVSATINERFEMYKQVDKDTGPAMNMAKEWRVQAYEWLKEYRLFPIEVI